MFKRKCPVCGGEDGELLHTVPLSIPEEMRKKINYPQCYDIVCCSGCGMVFADSQLSKEEVDNYYATCNMYDNVSNVKRDTYKEYAEFYYNSLIPYITSQSAIIDVGCGNGYFLGVLKDKGYENLYGLDPSVSSIEQLELKGIKGIVGSAYDDIPADMQNKFDVVILSGVLEHLLFPDLCLTNLTRLMREDGILYILVPDAQGFGEYLREVPNYFNQEHINYFTLNTLDYLCGKRGLSRCSSEENSRYRITPDTPEMIVSAMYTFADKMGSDSVPYDEEGKKSVKEYFRLMEQKQNSNRDAISKLLQGENQIIIWGTGALAASLLNEIPELINKVECFVDNNTNRQGDLFYGKKVIAPDELYSHKRETIMICIMINRASVEKQIQEMELTNKVFLLS